MIWPVHICCLFDPIRARTLADPSSEDKAYVCCDIINACAENTMADEFNGSRAQWTAETWPETSFFFFFRSTQLAKQHRECSKNEGKLWSWRAQIEHVVLGTVAGRGWDHQVITLNVYMKLCGAQRWGSAPWGRKTLCFYRLPGMCRGHLLY